MKNTSMHVVHVPATSANLGPGFDTLGMALDIYNSVVFCQSDTLTIELETSNPNIPLNSQNLIYIAAKRTADLLGRALPPLYLKQYDHIPMASGMGSSAACIVAGIYIADTLLNLWLSKKQILDIATQIEGHPDNVAPAIYGGLCLNQNNNGDILTLQIPVKGDIAVCIAHPSFSLSTKTARKVLPHEIPMHDAIYNLSCIGLFTSAFYTQDYSLLPYALQDKLHQPYRKHLIKGFDQIIKIAHSLGAYGTCISGAGPSMLSFIKESQLDFFAQNFSEALKEISGNWSVIPSKINKNGAIVEKFNSNN